MGKKHQMPLENHGKKIKPTQSGPAGKHDPRYVKTTPPIRRPGFVAKK